MKTASKSLLDIDLRVIEINFKTRSLGLTVGVCQRTIVVSPKVGDVL